MKYTNTRRGSTQELVYKNCHSKSGHYLWPRPVMFLYGVLESHHLLLSKVRSRIKYGMTSLFNNNQEAEDPQQKHLGMTPLYDNNGCVEDAEQQPLSIHLFPKKAFTLIELLVVVLIISILAAVAVPQYKLAVAKSQYIQAMVVGDAIYKAQQLYFLEHGTYAKDVRNIVDSLPAGYTLGTGVVRKTLSYRKNNKPFLTCSIEQPTAPYCRLDFYGQLYYIVHIEEGRRFCYVTNPNDFSARVCKSLSPKHSKSTQTFEL